MFSRFFINRPIFATVLALIMLLVGLVTVKTLPVAQYPDITPPTVMVSASYPGADATTVAQTVGVPIEEQVNGVEGMMYMSSSSGSDGSYSLTITFEKGTDIDNAAVKVQNRVSEAEPTLPTVVKEEGVSVQTRSSNILMFIALESDREDMDALYLTNYAQLHMVDALSRIDGVGNVGAFGGGEYSMRIWLDPELMRVRGISPADVQAAIEAQNMEVSAGGIGRPPLAAGQQFEYTLSANGRLTTPEEFGAIVIKGGADGSAVLRLRDVARVELGSNSYSNVSHVDGRQAAMLAVSQLPGANAVDVSKSVKAEMENLAQYLPEGVHYSVIMDTTKFVDASIDEVLVTFVETTIIVMIVILFFLQNARAVIIPMLTIPVSLIATFAVMKVLGFSLNTLTLFGLVLAIAIVVDDAIVVVEDCQRIVDQGKMTPRQAAIKAMQELTGPVVGEVLVLLSVFIPTAFISGITGELYKQFALTIAVSTAFSGFNALTFTPAMCALFLRPRKADSGLSRFFLFRWFNRGYNACLNVYDRTVGRFLRRPALAVLLYLSLCVLAFWAFATRPTSYIPEEDQGYYMASVQLPTGASLARTDSVMQVAAAKVADIPGVQHVLSFSGQSFLGGSGSNFGSMFVVLKPWKERGKDESVFNIIKRTDASLASIQEAVSFALDPPAIPGLGMSSGLQMELLDINSQGVAALSAALEQVQAAAEKDPRISSVTSTFEGEVPQYTLRIDRDRVESLGLDLAQVYSALSAYMGTAYVNDFNEFGRTYQVNLSANADARSQVDNIRALSVPNDAGQMVPFSAFSSTVPSMGQSSVNRYNMYQSASLTASTAHGTSSSQGIKAMEEIVHDTLGSEFAYAWTGEAYQETESGATILTALIFAVIITLLVLAAQYESWTDPIAVIISMPTAILGTVIGCFIMSQDINIYTQIGIILLLGLSAKNAILIVEYAIDYRKQGIPLKQAAQDAGRVRFRPIMMTAFAFVFGVMPMLFATGAGANSRIALGSAVVFGMAVNALVGTLFVPNFWELLQRKPKASVPAADNVANQGNEGATGGTV